MGIRKIEEETIDIKEKSNFAEGDLKFRIIFVSDKVKRYLALKGQTPEQALRGL